MNTNKKVTCEFLGLIDYKEAWDYQEKLLKEAIDLKIAFRNGQTTEIPHNYLLFCQHPHVYTLGKSGKPEHLLLNEEQLAEKEASYYKINRGDWVVEPSIRFQYYGTLSVFSPEPRLGVKYKVNERFRLKGATGKYTQNLMATNSDRDVVNLFYGFLASPEDLQNEFTGDPAIQADGQAVTSLGELVGGINDGLSFGRTPTNQQVKNVLQTAKHVVIGFEFDLSERWNLNVES